MQCVNSTNIKKKRKNIPGVEVEIENFCNRSFSSLTLRSERLDIRNMLLNNCSSPHYFHTSTFKFNVIMMSRMSRNNVTENGIRL
jgi:hypothetical protein